MTDDCFGSIQACRLRVALLDATGKPSPGAHSQVVTDKLIQIDWKLQVKAGAVQDLDTGCQVNDLHYEGRDKITGVTLGIQVTRWDGDLISLMTGGPRVVDGAGHTRGWALPQVGEDIDQEVSVEAWSLAWDGDEQAAPAWAGGDSDLLHHRWIFPRTTWVVGDNTAGTNPMVVQLNGKGRGNTAFGDGPGNDLPWDAYLSPMGDYLDDADLPAAACGYQALVPS